jgi:hypothetical protein
MVDLPRLTKAQREQVGDARLLLEAAAHNALIVAKELGGLDPGQYQALESAAAQAAQAAGTLRRVVLQMRKRDAPVETP